MEEEALEREMHKAVCSDCGAECEVPFKPAEGKPVRCQDCFRKSRPRNFRRGFQRPFRDRPREMHKATCAECKMECEIPFKPIEGKPVYCNECFRNRKGNQTDFE